MICYYDSSVILASVMDQHPSETLASLWDGATVRLSSWLIRIECLVVLRRLSARQPALVAERWIGQREAKILSLLELIDCKRVDEDIEKTIRESARLSDCRTLDAIHLATALFFQKEQDEPIVIATMDARMREVAASLGFEVRPES